MFRRSQDHGNIYDFLSAFSSKKETQSGVSFKKPFPMENAAEHFWLVDIELNDGKMFGYADNVPAPIQFCTTWRQD